MKRVFGVKVWNRYVALDELGLPIATGDSMAELARATPRCERRSSAELVSEGWRLAARTDEIESMARGAEWLYAPGAPFLKPMPARLLGAVLDRLEDLRRARPWESRRFPLDVSACTSTEKGDRAADWVVSAPDASAIFVRAGIVEIAFTGSTVTRTRRGFVRKFRRSDELVELEAVLDVAVQAAEGVDEGMLASSAAFAGDFASATAVCERLWARRAGGML